MVLQTIEEQLDEEIENIKNNLELVLENQKKIMEKLEIKEIQEIDDDEEEDDESLLISDDED